ncbi:MAG: exonuclease SbcCD subunit D [Thermomicrobiales bacterium]
MKLLHFADLHLGVDNYGTQDAATGVSSRSLDILRALDRIVERAVEEPADAVLFAGDLFKNRDPSPTLQRELARRVFKLVNAGVPIVILTGNHDLPGALGRATAAEIYEVLSVSGVSVVRDVSALQIQTRSGPLNIVAVPWVTRSTVLVQEAMRSLGDVELDEAIRAGISHQVRQLARQLDENIPSVLLAHVSLQGADFGLERSLMLGRDVTVGSDDLSASAFDYVALGHIHKHQSLGVRPPVVYSGSPERIDFGEEGEPKGYIWVEIDQSDNSKRVNWEFAELPARRFETLRIDATGGDPSALIDREIAANGERIRDAVVRLFVTVDAEHEAEISPAQLRRAIGAQDPFAVAGIKVESEEERRARLEVDLDEALDQSAMLSRWIETRGYDAQRAKLIESLGRDLITRVREKQSS